MVQGMVRPSTRIEVATTMRPDVMKRSPAYLVVYCLPGTQLQTAPWADQGNRAAKFDNPEPIHGKFHHLENAVRKSSSACESGPSFPFDEACDKNLTPPGFFAPDSRRLTGRLRNARKCPDRRSKEARFGSELG